MNKKRKLLTVLALVVFGVIITLHYIPSKIVQLIVPFVIGDYIAVIEDVRMPLFVLAVFYGGLFLITGGRKS
jgi:hypothetical protein